MTITDYICAVATGAVMFAALWGALALGLSADIIWHDLSIGKGVK